MVLRNDEKVENTTTKFDTRAAKPQCRAGGGAPPFDMQYFLRTDNQHAGDG